MLLMGLITPRVNSDQFTVLPFSFIKKHIAYMCLTALYAYKMIIIALPLVGLVI